jgi:hypothetical protein
VGRASVQACACCDPAGQNCTAARWTPRFCTTSTSPALTCTGGWVHKHRAVQAGAAAGQALRTVKSQREAQPPGGAPGSAAEQGGAGLSFRGRRPTLACLLARKAWGIQSVQRSAPVRSIRDVTRKLMRAPSLAPSLSPSPAAMPSPPPLPCSAASSSMLMLPSGPANRKATVRTHTARGSSKSAAEARVQQQQECLLSGQGEGHWQSHSILQRKKRPEGHRRQSRH